MSLILRNVICLSSHLMTLLWMVFFSVSTVFLRHFPTSNLPQSQLLHVLGVNLLNPGVVDQRLLLEHRMGIGTGIGGCCCRLILLPEMRPGIGQADATCHGRWCGCLMCRLLVCGMTLSQLVSVPADLLQRWNRSLRRHCDSLGWRR